MSKEIHHMQGFNLCDCVCASANWVTWRAVNQHKLTEMIIEGNQEPHASTAPRISRSLAPSLAPQINALPSLFFFKSASKSFIRFRIVCKREFPSIQK